MNSIGKTYDKLISGGFTLEPEDLSDYRGGGYGIALPEYESVIPFQMVGADLLESILLQYRAFALAREDEVKIGAWRNENNIYFDLTVIDHERFTAIETGCKNRQKAIWDFKAGKEIELWR